MKIALLLAAVLAFPTSAFARRDKVEAPPHKDGTLSLQKLATLGKDLSEGECKSDSAIPAKLADMLQKSYDKVDLVDDASTVKTGDALAAKITAINAVGGGAWSGPKYVTITGTLWQNGTVAGTFTASRYTTGGAWGGYKGTCSMIDNVNAALARDVTKWLNKPAMDSKLGDAK